MSKALDILNRSRKIAKPMKEKIASFVTSSSTYRDGVLTGLRKPSGLLLISLNANWKGITKKEIDFIESTG